MNRKQGLNIAQALVIACLVVFMVIMMAAGSSRDVSLDEISQTMAAQPGMEGLLAREDSAVYASYGLIPSEYLYWRTNEVMDVRELLIVKAANDEELEQVEEAAAKHLETQINNFTGYGTNQVDLLEHAVTTTRGSYYCLAIGDQAEAWQSAFLRLIG